MGDASDGNKVSPENQEKTVQTIIDYARLNTPDMVLELVVANRDAGATAIKIMEGNNTVGERDTKALQQIKKAMDDTREYTSQARQDQTIENIINHKLALLSGEDVKIAAVKKRQLEAAVSNEVVRTAKDRYNSDPDQYRESAAEKRRNQGKDHSTLLDAVKNLRFSILESPQHADEGALATASRTPASRSEDQAPRNKRAVG